MNMESVEERNVFAGHEITLTGSQRNAEVHTVGLFRELSCPELMVYACILWLA